MFHKDKKDKLRSFFRKNGFYLVLAVCVLGIGAGAFIGLGGEKEAKTPSEKVPAPQQSSSPVQAIRTPKPIQPTATPMPEVSAEPEPTEAPETKQASVGNRVRLTMPVDGEIIKAFSGDTLVYSPTLNMWMTHNGIDIAAEEGAEVAAALAGIVEEVKNDDSKGLVVTVSHGSNGKTVYAGLKETDLKKDAKINAGQTVGKVGTPAFESAQGPHLHFEYLVKEEYRDPVEYMK